MSDCSDAAMQSVGKWRDRLQRVCRGSFLFSRVLSFLSGERKAADQKSVIGLSFAELDITLLSLSAHLQSAVVTDDKHQRQTQYGAARI